MTTRTMMIVAVLTMIPRLSHGEPATANDPRPNIVFAFADDYGRYASAYREPGRPTLNDCLETPVFDRLAKNGVLFWDAHVSAPSCSPSRTSVLTGRHFYRNGSGSQLHNPWTGDAADDPVKHLESYHTLLEKAGYHTGVTYKTHVSMHLFVDEGHQYNKAGARVNTYSQQVAKGSTPEQRERIKEQLLGQVRENFQMFLDAGDAGQPFCWYFSPTNPHRSWEWESAQQQWGLNPDDLKGKMPAFLPDVPTVRQDMADYLGECMAFDAQVGVVVSELERRGLLENTIIVVSGDHGAPGFPRGKTNLYNFGSQVPLVIHWPAGIENPGRRIDNPTSLIDLAPTFLDAAGLPRCEQMDGRSLMPILKFPDAQGVSPLGNEYVITGRERHHFAGRPGHLPYPSRAIRTKDYLYVKNFKPDRWPVFEPPLTAGTYTDGDFDGGPTKAWLAENQNDAAYSSYIEWAVGQRPAEELYDLRNDVDQVTNLAGRPEHEVVRRDLHDRLMMILTDTGDPRVVGEGDAFDRPPYLKSSGR
jgi:arylsulfatase A-like enzyme